MKRRFYRAKVVLLMLSIISVMEMTACSLEPKEETATSEAIVAPKTIEETTEVGILETKTTKTENEKAEIETTAAEETSTNESEIMAYITDFDADNIGVDAIEWVTVPSSRADELGITEEDGPSGFYIHNPDTLIEQFTLSTDCTITILDWQNSFEPQTISAEKFVTILQERGEQNIGIPYSLEITNGEITQISEHYVP